MRFPRFALLSCLFAGAAFGQTSNFYFVTKASWSGSGRAGGIATDANGNTYIPVTNANTILKVDVLGDVSTFASGLNGPMAVALDDSNNLYVAEWIGNDVRKITPGGTVSTFATSQALAAAGNGNGQAPFGFLAGIAVDGSGNVYVVSQGNSSIVKVTPAGVCSSFAGAPWQPLDQADNPTTTNGISASQEYQDGPAATALFHSPTGIAADRQGNVFVADSGNGAIRKISGGAVTTIAGGTSDVAIDGCDYLAVDAQDDIYFTGQTVQELTAGGQLVTLASVDQDTWPHFVNGVGSDATFDGPTGIAIPPLGTVEPLGTHPAALPGFGSYPTVANLYIADDTSLRAGFSTDYTNAQLTPPSIVSTSPGGTSNAGAASPTLAVTSNSVYTYQWLLNGAPILGATGASYTPGQVASYQWSYNNVVETSTPAMGSARQVGPATTGVLGPVDAGNYTVIVTDPYGNSQTLDMGSITVAENAWLLNLSGRAQVGTGQNVLIAGFVTAGPGSKSILVRGDGPSLAAFGVAGAVTAPQLQLFSGSSTITGEIAGWSGSLGPIFTATGAFAFPGGSADDATLQTLAAGDYTAIVSSANGTPGVAIAEVYDADAASNAVKGTSLAGPPTNRLVNLSARANVGSGSNVLIGGFVISGTTAKTVLLRAPGPSLAQPPFNLSGTVTATTLSLYDGSSQLIASTAGTFSPVTLGTSSLLTGANPQVGLEPASDADFQAAGAYSANWSAVEASLVATLPPGSYTIIVSETMLSGINNSAGIGMVEIYELN